MNPDIKSYYDQLAGSYDQNRFGNTYGQYIDAQEKKLLSKLVVNASTQKTLDIACGTGRFLPYADYGIDISPEMISVAQSKFPDKHLSVQSATSTDFEDETFELLLSFHLVMHLDKETTAAFLAEAARILRPGGRLIFDAPSARRRKLLGYRASGWHGANAYRIQEISELPTANFQLKNYYGIAFFPIHRIPRRLRRACIWLDNLLCRSFLREYASYLIFVLEKR